MRLSESERQVMEVFWKNPEPLTASDIIKQSSDKSWSDSYIFLMINSLRKKGAIELVGYTEKTKSIARTFKVKMTKEDYFAQWAIANDRYNDNDIYGAIRTLLSAVHNKETVIEIKRLVEKRYEEFT